MVAGVGIIVGPSLGGTLAAFLNYDAPFYVLIGIALIVFLCILFFIPNTIQD